ncbi:MAG: hypothetical protein LBP59_08000 [Planctomycetaceae bacterium]|jgi:YVTN family beta-propeller protein|nr:hypothetical protein [Planctomycetaceae bacterium]
MNKLIYKLIALLFVALMFLSVSQFCTNAVEVSAYKSPLAMVASKDATKIYIANYDGNEINVLDVKTDKISGAIPLGKKPNGIILSADGKTLYATSGSYNGVVQAIDLSAAKVIAEVITGHTPTNGVATPDGKKLFVCNKFNADVSEFDLPELKLVRKIKTVREPCGAVITPDGKKIYVINKLPNDINNFHENENMENATFVASSITIIDPQTGTTNNFQLPRGNGNLNGITITPDGNYIFVTGIIARYQVPVTHIERGWQNTNCVSIFDATKSNEPNGGYLTTILLDEVYLGAANPYGITTSPDGKLFCAAIAGTSEIITVNIEKLIAKINTLKPNPQNNNDKFKRTADGPKNIYLADAMDDLAFLEGNRQRIKIAGNGARSIIMINNNVYVGMYFSDVIQKIDITNPNVNHVAIPLGAKPQLTAARRGEIYWNNASKDFCFQSWHSCATCHPDGRTNAFSRDLMNDGMGNPKNVKSLVWSHKTPPTTWTALRKSTKESINKKFFYLSFISNINNVSSFEDYDLIHADEPATICDDVYAYIKSLEPEKSPFLVDGKLSKKAESGKIIFEDKITGCADCHPAPLYTDKKLHNVNSKAFYDHGKTEFDTPTLIELWRTAPYMHDGRYVELKDLLKNENHGNTKNLSDKQIDELVEYLLSL